MAAVLSFGGIEKNIGGQDNSHDANAALTELDKGLRSSKPGEQCEAVVRFPCLFEKYPFPILINSAFLKLGDVFRNGSNFLRLCVLKVTQQSERHLDKILNVDEFLRRVYSVIHSNDPIARAITVRVLGSTASIIAERKNVHHSIRSSLDSHDQVELEAAIFATDRFCAQSRDFASGICNKIAQMIEGVSTPVDMKLKLIPIFKHMHYDVQLATKVRELCSSLLSLYPASRFIEVTLHTLSCLAAASVIDIPEQVDSLLLYLKKDPRKAIKIQVLADLKMLAQEAAHMWQTGHTQALCEFLLETPYDALKFAGLRTLVTLSGSKAVHCLNQEKVLEVCDKESNSPNMLVSALSARVLVNITRTRVNKGDDQDLCHQAAMTVETATVVCCVNQQIEPLKVCLSSMNQLVEIHPQVAPSFVESLSSVLSTTSGPIALELCHTMVLIATQIPAVLWHLRGEITQHFCDVVSSVGKMRDENVQDSDNLVVAMATLVFQAHEQSSNDKEVSVSRQEVEQLVLTQLELLKTSSRNWTVFRVARQATRLGFHSLAAKLFDRISSKVASEHFYLWLGALKCFSEAEGLLSRHCDSVVALAQTINEASSKYQRGLVALKAAVTPHHRLSFQHTYAKLRAEMLQAHSVLLASCASMKFCPPPAIATAVAMATGMDVHSLSHFAAQISECSKLFRNLGEKYGSLYQSSFDADPVSLQNVETLQQSCFLISHCINVLMKNTQTSDFQLSSAGIQNAQKHSERIKESALSAACTEILGAIEKLAVELEETPVCHLQNESLCKASLTLLQVPFVFPKYFFHSHQTTVIKLALSPAPRIPSDVISVMLDSQFVLKVEGVIEHKQKQGFFRRVQSVCLLVTWRAEEKRNHTSDIKAPRDSVTSLEQTVHPHNDYFSAQFLLSFSSAATHTVTVSASVVDDTGVHWETGPQGTLSVKTAEAPSRQPRAGPSRS